MLLELENVCYIKKAEVIIDGLTVITGTNDTGKSTVGKVLMALIKADNIARQKIKNKQSKNFISNRIESFNKQIELLFDKNLSLENLENSLIRLTSLDRVIYNVKIEKNRCVEFNGLNENDTRYFLDCTYLQTPLVWDLYDFFVSIATIRTENDIYGFEGNIQYPYILWDLFGKLAKKRIDCDKKLNLINDINYTINGEFIKENGIFYFLKNLDKSELKIPLKNLSTGIKSFGILQILLDNCYLTPYGLFIFDEPEIHLHPEWQLKFAMLITELVKNNIKIIVNTHSPYMIEALKRYSELENIENITNFYLAEKGYIKLQYDLEEIFDKLVSPMKKLKELKWKSLKK